MDAETTRNLIATPLLLAIVIGMRRIAVESEGAADVALTVRFPTPAGRKGELEQEIMRSWVGHGR